MLHTFVEKIEVIKKETGERIWIKGSRFNPELHEACDQGVLIFEGVLVEETNQVEEIEPVISSVEEIVVEKPKKIVKKTSSKKK